MTNLVADKPQTRTPVWSFQNVTKRFPGVVANSNISFDLFPGEIHGLMGENGSGKSTIIKTFMGVHQPDKGQILNEGAHTLIENPKMAHDKGIAAVFQEFSIVPTLSVAENIFLGRLPLRGPLLDWSKMRKETTQILARLNVNIDPDAIMSDLSVADQQLVEIAKAIATNASLVILDEPTAALGSSEIDELHVVLRRLKKQGTAILYVSHRLDEAVGLVDCATILKDGVIVSSASETQLVVEAVVEAMVGKVSDHYPKRHNVQQEVALELVNVSTLNRVRNVSFSVNRGEVFGLCGVLGSGRTEIARAIFGVDRLAEGEIRINGKATKLTAPEDAVAAGIALIPENRKFDGLFFNFDALKNLSIANISRFTSFGFLRLARERQLGSKLISKLAILQNTPPQTVGFLSGGNQQKVVLARWLFAEAEVFVLDEPTQGIDVGARVSVYELINDLTAAGKAVVLISSDHDELISMSDRIGIVSHGQLVTIQQPAEVSQADFVRATADENI